MEKIGRLLEAIQEHIGIGAVLPVAMAPAPIMITDTGGAVNLGADGTSSCVYSVANGVCSGHAEFVFHGTGRDGGSGAQYFFELPVEARDPNVDSPLTHDYFIGSGMVGRAFGGHDTPGSLWIPSNAPTGFEVAKCAQLLIGHFFISGVSSFAAGTSLNVAHNLGVTPQVILAAPFGTSQGIITSGADATNLIFHAQTSSSNPFFWIAGFGGTGHSVVGPSYPWKWGGTAGVGGDIDHIEVNFKYPVAA